MSVPMGKPATSFNAQDRKWVEDMLDGGGGGLPTVTGSDNGDVLTVVEGVWAKASPTAELPAVTSSNNGSVLTVVEGAWSVASLPVYDGS